MKAIVTPAIFTSFSSRADKSLGFRGVTPELSSTEKVALIDLQGVNLRLLIEPVDFATDGKTEIKGVLSSKSPSERLRACLFVLWKQLNEADRPNHFDIFYMEQMERFINDVKSHLEERTE